MMHKTFHFDSFPRNSISAILCTILLLVGCGSKEKLFLDDTLKTVKKNIEQGQYDEAIKILESYSNEKKKAIASKHILFADAYYGLFKKEIQDFEDDEIKRGLSDTWDNIISLIKEIKNHLKIAESISTKYQNIKWKYFLKYEGLTLKCNSIDTPINSARTTLYSAQEGNIKVFKRVANAYIQENIIDHKRHLTQQELNYKEQIEYYNKGQSTKGLVDMTKRGIENAKKRLKRWQESPYDYFILTNTEIINVYILDEDWGIEILHGMGFDPDDPDYNEANNLIVLIENARSDFLKAILFMLKTDKGYEFKAIGYSAPQWIQRLDKAYEKSFRSSRSGPRPNETQEGKANTPDSSSEFDRIVNDVTNSNDLKKRQDIPEEIDLLNLSKRDIQKYFSASFDRRKEAQPPSISGVLYMGRNAQGFYEYKKVLRGDLHIVFVLIPGGRFLMGSDENERRKGLGKHEGPKHEVQLSSFLLAKHEITQTIWREVMGTNPSYTKGGNLPITNVSWFDCERFCEITNLDLPTEAQWEFACRGKNIGKFGFGNHENELKKYAYYLNRPGGTCTNVGSRTPNAYGLHDMLGNVEEWCFDVFNEEFYSQRGASVLNPVCLHDPRGIGYRCTRGGCWQAGPYGLRTADRGGYPANNGCDIVGLRPAKRLP